MTARSTQRDRLLSELAQRAFAIDRGLAVGEERFPRHALRIGDPLLVGFGVTAVVAFASTIGRSARARRSYTSASSVSSSAWMPRCETPEARSPSLLIAKLTRGSSSIHFA